MSRFFPHTEYAEDQPLGRMILAAHVVTRATTVGAFVGIGIFGTRVVFQRLLRKAATTVATSRARLFLRVVGHSTLWTTIGIVSFGLIGRMWGREEIEWKDRAWRLRENKGQLETDDWTYGGMAVGLIAATALLKRPVGWPVVVGSAGTGSVAGTLGYLGWRYGVYGGKFEEEVKLA